VTKNTGRGSDRGDSAYSLSEFVNHKKRQRVELHTAYARVDKSKKGTAKLSPKEGVRVMGGKRRKMYRKET